MREEVGDKDVPLLLTRGTIQKVYKCLGALTMDAIFWPFKFAISSINDVERAFFAI